MGILYRASQFWKALTQKPDPDDLAFASQVLSPELMELFLSLQPGEQAHSLHIFKQLTLQGEKDPELLTAALLHDVGKSRYPMMIWERVMIVLGKRLFPVESVKWGQSDPKSWKRAFVVAEKHPAWGAEMARQSGASPLVVNLIKNHQVRAVTNPGLENQTTLEQNLLYRLQVLDDKF